MNVEMVLGVPRNCKLFFVDAVLALNSVSTCVSLVTQFLKLFHSLLQLPSKEVLLVSRQADKVQCNFNSREGTLESSLS